MHGRKALSLRCEHQRAQLFQGWERSRFKDHSLTWLGGWCWTLAGCLGTWDLPHMGFLVWVTPWSCLAFLRAWWQGTKRARWELETAWLLPQSIRCANYQVQPTVKERGIRFHHSMEGLVKNLWHSLLCYIMKYYSATEID